MGVVTHVKPALHQGLELLALLAAQPCLLHCALPAVNLLLVLRHGSLVPTRQTSRD